ncbi:hypothetical protein GCM10023176_33390 [Micromonospora coerulea]|uniref:Uncharacterized protein n=1 Tax=Micromonospora coerulea TaxID=47856 RepID=A0ABP8SLW6_9ACTN
MSDPHRLIIIGSGPAGYTAAVPGLRAQRGLRVAERRPFDERRAYELPERLRLNHWAFP